MYHAGTFSDFVLLKSNVECDSNDKKLGDFNTLAECASACKQRCRLQIKQPALALVRGIDAKCCLFLWLYVFACTYEIEVGFFQERMMYVAAFAIGLMEFNSCVPCSMVFQQRMQVFHLWQERCAG